MIFQKQNDSAKHNARRDISQKIQRLMSALDKADAILIGAGAGLSASAGFDYSGERFEKYFSDFAAKYRFSDMYSGGFAPFESLEEHWAYWSRYIMLNRYMDAPKSVYADLFRLVRGRDYFVITTNVDHCFQKAGFDKQKLYYTQGDFGLFQCPQPCHQKTYDNEQTIRAMFENQRGMKVPPELIPHCPVCGRPMAMNLRADNTFVQDEGWYRAAERYEHFLNSRRAAENGRILFLELGVGANTPGIIKYPFWEMTAHNPNAVYACINFGEAIVPEKIGAQSICIDADIGEVIEKLMKS